MTSSSLTCLLGKTFNKVRKEAGYPNDGTEQLILFSNDIEVYALFHEQECCENVYIKDIVGDLNDLQDVPILVAEKRSETMICEDNTNLCAYTFYEFRTIKGSVTIQFQGESNGYYGVDINLYVRRNSHWVYV